MSTITQNNLQDPLNPNIKFKQYSFRIVIVLLFSLLSFANGMCWVVVSPISVPIAQAYEVSEALVALIPMSYMIVYIFINFPSNWVLDVKGIKKGIITGSILTAIGAGIRCLVPYSFSFLILGQVVCAIGQPFILNAPTKIATRWFMPKNRSLALAVLAVVNIIGTAIGFVVPSLFVTTVDNYDISNYQKSTVKDSFWTLLFFQFCVCLVAALLNLFFFKEKPPTLPSLGSMVQNIEFKKSLKQMFSSKKFLSLAFAFSTINGAFNIYGSLLDSILDPFNYTNDQVSTMAAIMMVIGIISAGILGIYIQKTLNYRRVFIILGIIGILQTLGFTIVLKFFNDNYYLFLLMVALQGIIFIPLMPLSFDYGCDILFPMGQAQITGTLMTAGQILGIFLIVMSQHVFKLGDKSVDNKEAAFYTSILVGVFTIIGCGCYLFFNSQLKRSKLQNTSGQDKVKKESSSLLTQSQKSQVYS